MHRIVVHRVIHRLWILWMKLYPLEQRFFTVGLKIVINLLWITLRTVIHKLHA